MAKKTKKKAAATKTRTTKKRIERKATKRKPIKKTTTKRKPIKRTPTKKKPTSEEIRAWVANQVHASIAANQPEESADAYKAAAEYFGLSEMKIRNAEKYIEP